MMTKHGQPAPRARLSHQMHFLCEAPPNAMRESAVLPVK